MTDSNLISLLLTFGGGLVAGILLTLLFNKLRSGSASPASVKREMDDYQQKVEAHFDETSDKFKAMAEQYKDLYQHLSVGATSLCRPEHVVPGLTDASDPLKDAPKKIASEPAKETAAASDTKTEQPSASTQKTVVKDPADADKPADAKPDQQKSKAADKAPSGSVKDKGAVKKSPK